MTRRDILHGAFDGIDPVERRQFLRLMAASLALAGATACTKQPPEKIVPYVRQPERVVPGQPLFFATAMPLAGAATGLLVESHLGRPTKVEGNPGHPSSLGATDLFAQASVLGLYDPDRSQTISHLGEIAPWSSCVAALRTAVDATRPRNGAGLRILTETVSSPTLADQLQRLLREFPAAEWHQYEPAARDAVRTGAQLAFGQYVDTQYRFEEAAVVLSLDADFLSTGPGLARHVRDFSRRRSVREGRHDISRLYVVETVPSATGERADHRLPLRAGHIENFALLVAAALGVPGVPADRVRAEDIRSHLSSADLERWIRALVGDLKSHEGASIVIPGDGQPAALHALAHAMNETLGNAEKTVAYTAPAEANPVSQTDSLRKLVEDVDAGQVELLVIAGGNPVYNAPGDLRFNDRIARVPLRVHLGLYHDETAVLCHWHIPEAHYLEAWSDVRGHDGTASIIQPLIAPLYGGKTVHEVIGAISGQDRGSGHDIVRNYWRGWHTQQGPGGAFEQWWQQALHDGLVPGNAAPSPKDVAMQALAVSAPLDAGAAAPRLDVVFRLDPTVHDGRFANNAWLQETPKPSTRLTWDNAAQISRPTAERFGLANGDLVELRYRGRTVEAPIWILAGLPDDSVVVHLGYGRVRAGRVGSRLGFDAYALRTSDAPWFGSGVEIRKLGRRYPLACAQPQQRPEGRRLARSVTLARYRQNPRFLSEQEPEPARSRTLYPEHKYEGHAWGMVIDLQACVGCNACVVACQAENNVAVVGKTEVARGHRMHWLRIDRYETGPQANPRVHNQPIPCMQCENAPCEPVCPVGATVHSREGLNDQVYNRCVGTRYCSNNCPYKVRRFNFFLVQDWHTASLQLMRNPDVTVRSRGVMEKCTYCVQRIVRARIEAEKEGRPIRDGEVVTACQAACPADAIVFGDINDRTSRVARLKAEPTGYGLLADLNTRPRTTYLAAVSNPNPEVPGEETDSHEGEG